ncbi:hemolysin family protein [Methyloceanibacter methanicus]|uniref:hemolysin family protein n=1 Tax=Methyloceanibacter methanicus TaxID=1774968 RepID=UPI00084975E6|nr:hemolysin family protein [Methyloceanibacter methanicus]
MSNPAPERETEIESARAAEDESTWFDRLLQTFGLSDEPDLRTLIESALLTSKSDALDPQERSMMRRILRFGTLTVEDVMVPRADIVAVDDSVSIEDLLRVFRKSEHSRVPVYRETLDDPRGMIHIRDLMSWITEEANGGDESGIDLGKVDLARSAGSIAIARELIYVPPSMSVLDLLLKMQTAQLHLALVVDEYGGTDGLVSIEDLVEEIVGDIADEHDVEDEPMLEKDSVLGLVADARLPIEELEDYLGVDLVTEEQEEDIDTLGGVVYALAGRIPARGELVGHPSGIEFEVLDADPRRIKRLRIHLPKEHAGAGGKSSGKTSGKTTGKSSSTRKAS